MTLLTLGLAFHAWVGYEVLTALPLGVWAAVGLGPLLVVAVIARLRPDEPKVRWLTGIPFAMVLTAAFGAIAIVGGALPKGTIQSRLGVESIWSSWPFVFVSYGMLVNLVGSCGRRAWPLNTKNALYLLSHMGLATALIGGAVSGLTLERRTMVLFQGVPTDIAYDQHNNEYHAPFTVTLREFRMETFAPTFAVVSLDESAEDGMRQISGSTLAKVGLVETIDGYRVEVLRYLPKAVHDGRDWREVPWKTAAPAALVKVRRGTDEVFEGWVCSGSVATQAAYLPLGPNQALFMNRPMPKVFESDLEIDGRKVTVGVNKPAKVDGFDVYQFSYDEKAGPASPYSVVEVVRDPGLFVVYVGIFMLLAAAVLHLGQGVGGKR